MMNENVSLQVIFLNDELAVKVFKLSLCNDECKRWE